MPILLLLAGFGVIVVSGQRAMAQGADLEVSYSQAVRVAAGTSKPVPQRFTHPCPTGELVSGGLIGLADYSGLDVVSSYPSDGSGNPTANGARPVAWTVVVINWSSSADYRVLVAVGCLTGITARATVASAVSQRFGSPVTATCSPGQQRSGGGFRSTWSGNERPRILGSYPVFGDKWSVDTPAQVVIRSFTGAEQPTGVPASTSAYAVCLTGDLRTRVGPTSFLSDSKRYCPQPVSDFVADCINSTNGFSYCDGDGILTGGGFQLISGAPSGFFGLTINSPRRRSAEQRPVNISPPRDLEWGVTANESDSDVKAVKVQVSTVCLEAKAAGAPDTPGGSASNSSSDLDGFLDKLSRWLEDVEWPIVGAWIFVLLLVYLVFRALNAIRKALWSAAVRRSGQRKTKTALRQGTVYAPTVPSQSQDNPSQPVQLQVYIRHQQAVYGTYKETP
ncbi:MAG TPA: hypothetical protein VFC19_48185 [Candidatus Limnocylindrales bacterium]|nr:hypothetical protein [Candidatus Limnocylindrales bacterium]